MRTYSIYAIALLCLAIIIVDMFSFYWLQSIIKHLDSKSLKATINLVFWIFTIGLVSAILILKVKMDAIPSRKKQLLISSLYGLTVSSFIPKIIFVIIISILYFSNYFISETDSLIIVPAFGLVAGFFPFFVIVYAIFRAIYRFKIYHIPINSKSLPKAFDGLRIVHISDLHLGSFNYRYKILERAVELINELKPDLVFFTGDLVNNYAWELRGWEPVLEEISAKLGKFSVLGNHDYGDYTTWETPEAKEENFELVKKFHKNIGFSLLLNEGVTIEKGGEAISIVGVENWGKGPFKDYGDLKKALGTVNTSFKILLSHDPSHWNEEVTGNKEIVLTLSGHTHGMQAGLKLMGNQWSPIKYKYKQWAGLYKFQDQYLYVTRGLGWIGFPGRLGMRPEITCIKLQIPSN
jgi:predicted MPP superfamily phosphohydrolase